jgi:hypothetical protein
MEDNTEKPINQDTDEKIEEKQTGPKEYSPWCYTI